MGFRKVKKDTTFTCHVILRGGQQSYLRYVGYQPYLINAMILIAL